MTAFTFEAGELKDHMLVNTMSLLMYLHQQIAIKAKELNIPPNSYFFDVAEPSTGLPYLTSNSPSIYSEVEGGGSLLKYPREQSGSCCLLKHPIYGLNCYPSTFFLAGFPIDAFYQVVTDLSVGYIWNPNGVVE